LGVSHFLTGQNFAKKINYKRKNGKKRGDFEGFLSGHQKNKNKNCRIFIFRFHM
jgi:hypothetical protein